MKDHSEKPPKDKKKSNPNSKYYPDGNDISTSTAEINSYTHINNSVLTK